jgi:ribosome-associated protein
MTANAHRDDMTREAFEPAMTSKRMPHTPTPSDLERAEEIRFEFFRASGPGGQNVNKVATAVRLRFDVARSRLLSEPVRQRLTSLARGKMTARGVLVIEAQRYRTQERNRDDAMERLGDLLRRASQPPRPRRATKPSRESKMRRLEAKRRRGRLKVERARKIKAEE